MSVEQLRSVSIVVAGEATTAGQAFIDSTVAEAHNYAVFDLRKYGFDSDQLGRAWRIPMVGDGDDLRVQLALLTDERVVDVVTAIVESMLAQVEESKVFVIFDSTGVVPDFVAKVIANRVLNIGATVEERAFNCGVFSLYGATPEHLDTRVVA